MKNIEARLKEWLDRKIGDSEFKGFVCDNKDEIEKTFSKGAFLKLKHFDRKVARELIDKSSPCKNCSFIQTIEQALTLSNNSMFTHIKRPNYVSRIQLISAT